MSAKYRCQRTHSIEVEEVKKKIVLYFEGHCW